MSRKIKKKIKQRSQEKKHSHLKLPLSILMVLKLLDIVMEVFIGVQRKLMIDMVKVRCCGLITPSTRVSGEMTGVKEKVPIGTQMEANIKGCGKTIRLMGMVFLRILMDRNMKACGRMIFSMAREQRHGKMVLCTKVSIWKGKSMDKGIRSGPVEPNTAVTGI